MGISVVQVEIGSAPSATVEAVLARFCTIDPARGLTSQAARIHAPDAICVVERDGRPDGRCALWWNKTPCLPDQRIGLIGHYAAERGDTAAQVLDAACARLRAAGCTMAVGPMDGSTWRRYRLITWRGTDPLFFLEPDNPDDWPAHFDAAGFTPLAHYYSSKCDDLRGYPADDDLDARLRTAGYRMRPLDLARIDNELGLLWSLACDAFSQNFLYAPISESEFRQIYAPAVGAIRPELVRVAEQGGKPVAFIFAVPDMLQAAAGTAVDTLIVKTLGVIKARHGRGIGSWLVDSAFVQARTLGFRKGVFALMHEDNVSRRMGRGRVHDIRRYTLYARPL